MVTFCKCANCDVEFKHHSKHRHVCCSERCSLEYRRKTRAPIIRGDHAVIPLTKGMFAIIDIDDIPLVRDIIWHAGGKRVIYAMTYIPKNAVGARKNYLLSRFILGITDPSICVDHANRDTLDNRRINLRACTYSQNSQNRLKVGGNKYKGTHLFKGKYRASFTLNKKQICSGSFDTEEEAGIAYDIAAKKHFGEFAVLNFPDRVY